MTNDRPMHEYEQMMYRIDQYADLVSWNQGFGLPQECREEWVDEEAVHFICFCLQNYMCDREIAQVAHVHEHIVKRIRSTAIYSEYSHMYVFPIIFTNQMMMERIRVMIVEEGEDVVSICHKTGVDQNVVARMYNQYRQSSNDRAVFDHMYAQQKSQQALEDTYY